MLVDVVWCGGHRSQFEQQHVQIAQARLRARRECLVQDMALSTM